MNTCMTTQNGLILNDFLAFNLASICIAAKHCINEVLLANYFIQSMPIFYLKNPSILILHFIASILCNHLIFVMLALVIVPSLYGK